MKVSDDAPLFAGLSAVALAVFLGERLLQTEELQFWQQGVVYLGEVLFGLIVADLLWWLAHRPFGASPQRLLLYGIGALIWLLAVLAAANSNQHQGAWAVGGGILLISAVALTNIPRRHPVSRRSAADHR